MFRTVSLYIITSLALYTQLQIYVTEVMLTACFQAVSITCMYCCVYSAKTHDDVQRYCPKHVESYSKNKLKK